MENMISQIIRNKVLAAITVIFVLYGALYGTSAFLARRAYAAGDYKRAESYYLFVVRLNPWARTAYGRLGFIELDKNKDVISALRQYLPLRRVSTFYKSARYSERAIALGLRKPWVYQNAAFAYDNLYVRSARAAAKSDEWKQATLRYKTQAIFFYQKSLEQNQNNPVVYSGLGAIYYQERDYPKAVEYLKKAVELNPNDVRIYILLGYSQVELKDFSSAVNNFERAMRSKDYKDYFDLGAVHSKKGQAHLMLKEYDLAIAELNKGISLKPKFISAYFWRASAFLARNQIGDILKAKNDFQIYVQRRPSGIYIEEARAALKNL